jgi:hypothetical protein
MQRLFSKDAISRITVTLDILRAPQSPQVLVTQTAAECCASAIAMPGKNDPELS